ncbi:hypothetical protein C8Q74DRAFT_1368229 [Fomes fomentarius]|nr:hypothetical protein C8Q74DRAFT_1368229 [Fomes fomentarius]
MDTSSYEETTALLPREKYVAYYVPSSIQIKPLRYAEVYRAANGSLEAMRNDSLTSYLADADYSKKRKIQQRLENIINVNDAVYRHKALTVDRGDALLIYGLPGQKRIGPLLPWFIPLFKLGQSAELMKRMEEVNSKVKAIYSNVFGDKIKDMFEIQVLATVPAKQGRGYGTALVKTVNKMADERGRAAYLLTTDAYRFYETVGYKLVGEDWLGVDNPSWTGAPVPVRVDADHPWSLRVRLLVQNIVNLWDSVYRGKLYAIDNGDAIIGFAIPGRKDAGPLLPWIKPLLAKFGTAEYWKRIGEFESAMKSIFDEAVGSQVDEMLEVQMLVTHPTKQGRGYGSALMETVNDVADAQGLSTFVVTSDPYRFYEAVGYKLVGERWLGVDNPRWKGEPVPVRVLAREPHIAGVQTS